MLEVMMLGLLKMGFLWMPIAILIGGCAAYELYKDKH